MPNNVSTDHDVPKVGGIPTTTHDQAIVDNETPTYASPDHNCHEICAPARCAHPTFGQCQSLRIIVDVGLQTSEFRNR
jgi:hypothetical protein